MEDIFDKIQVVTGISKYSGSEVITPKWVVTDMVDLLPPEVFTPETRFLDPAVKSGRFLIEIYRRLIESELMKQAFPEEQVRRKHILENQLYGLATSPVAATVTRKALYNDPTITGNIVYVDRYLVKMADKTTDFKKLVQGEFGENMKFDVVIGNPPYQEDTGGGRCGGKPLYQNFVTKSFDTLSSRYACMIIPAKWYISNKDTKQFTSWMLDTNTVRHIKDFANSTEIFPEVSIGGGICYFVMDKEYRGKCLVENCTYTNETVVTEGSGIRPLNTFDLKEDEVFIRNQSDLSIILKVLEQKDKSISTTCSNVSPFGLKTTVDANVIRTSDTEVEIIKSYDETAYIERDEISKGIDLIDKYNVITGTLNADGGMALVSKGGLLNVINKPKILSPAQVCTLTYMVISSFDTMEQATNCAEYLKTKFIRFLISRLVGSAYMTYKQYRLVPLLDFSHPWTDQLLYEKYGLTQDEINHIEATIKPME